MGELDHISYEHTGTPAFGYGSMDQPQPAITKVWALPKRPEFFGGHSTEVIATPLSRPTTTETIISPPCEVSSEGVAEAVGGFLIDTAHAVGTIIVVGADTGTGGLVTVTRMALQGCFEESKRTDEEQPKS